MNLFLRIILVPYTVLLLLLPFLKQEDLWVAIGVAIAYGFLSTWLVAHRIASPLRTMLQRLRVFPGLSTFTHGRMVIPEIAEVSHAMQEFMDRLKSQLEDITLEKELLQSLLHGLREGVLCLNKDGIVVFQNNAIDHRIVSAEAEGKPYYEVIKHHSVLGKIRTMLRASDESNEVQILEISQGNIFYKVRCHPVVVENKPQLFLIIVQDDTEEQNIKRLREDFLQNASHELKTPVTSIRGYTETILYRSKDEQQNAFLKAILRNVERMERIIEDMVTISSVESGAFPFNPVQLSCTEYMESIRELATGFLKSKKQNLIVKIDPEDLKIFADPLLLEHMFLNLIVNASRYSPEETQIQVAIQRTGRDVNITVEDQGPGVDHQFSEKIFERFFRADKNRSRTEGGTGLGLSIVRQIARIHDGKVWVDNSPNGGAIFHISFPTHLLAN